MTTIDPREARLPRWVQSTINKLRDELDTAEKTIRDLTADPASTNTIAQPFRDEALPLPNNAYIRFRWSTDQYGDRVYINARLDGDSVEIQGSDMLTIYPQSGNVVRIGLAKR